MATYIRQQEVNYHAISRDDIDRYCHILEQVDTFHSASAVAMVRDAVDRGGVIGMVRPYHSGGTLLETGKPQLFLE